MDKYQILMCWFNIQICKTSTCFYPCLVLLVILIDVMTVISRMSLHLQEYLGFFLSVDSLRPSQQFFSHVGRTSCLPGFNKQYSEEYVSC